MSILIFGMEQDILQYKEKAMKYQKIYLVRISVVLLLFLLSSCASSKKTVEYQNDVVNVVKTLYKQVHEEYKEFYGIYDNTLLFINNDFNDVFMWLYEKQIDGNYDVNFLVNDEEIKKIFFNDKSNKYYKSQAKKIKKFPMELFDKNGILIKKENVTIQSAVGYRTSFPVFSKDGNYAIYFAIIASRHLSGVMIDKKDENGNWVNFKTFKPNVRRH